MAFADARSSAPVGSSRAIGKLMSPTIRLSPGPLHSTCNAKVAPSRFLLRMVHRPKPEIDVVDGRVHRRNAQIGAVSLAYLIFRIRTDQREVVCTEDRRCERRERNNT